jgi:shikimate kinase
MSNIYPQKKIVLIGYMASGKSTISNYIGDKMAFETADTDLLIEKKVGLPISEIFDNYGELYFRKLESQIFNELLNQNKTLVIATGGGLPCYFNNHQCLQSENVLSIYLKLQPQTLVNRLIADRINRPIVAQIGEDNLLEFVSKHLFERSFYYLQAKHIITCDEKSVEDIVGECIALVLSA